MLETKKRDPHLNKNGLATWFQLDLCSRWNKNELEQNLNEVYCIPG